MSDAHTPWVIYNVPALSHLRLTREPRFTNSFTAFPATTVQHTGLELTKPSSHIFPKTTIKMDRLTDEISKFASEEHGASIAALPPLPEDEFAVVGTVRPCAPLTHFHTPASLLSHVTCN